MTTKSNPTTYRLDNFYDIYRKSGTTRRKNLDKKTFKKVMKVFLHNVQETLIEGNEVRLGYRLGWLKVGRFDRNFSNPQPNWGESNKYKAQLLAEGKELYNKETGTGHEWIIYFTDSYFYGFLWKKEKAPGFKFITLHNAFYYQLKIYARTQRKLAAAIDELAPITYQYVPSIFDKV